MEHQTAVSEIQRMELFQRCKRRAENEDAPLRQIFDDVCRTASSAAGQHISFADLEASMYERRRRALPSLPTSSAEADSAVSNSRYAQLEASEFYRGVADAGDNRSALIRD